MTNENDNINNNNDSAQTNVDCNTPSFKKMLMLRLLSAEPHIKIHLDGKHPKTILPLKQKSKSHIVLDIGYGLGLPIPDLLVRDDGVSCTLSFERTPFLCFLPWEAVFAMAKTDGSGITFNDAMPQEVAEEHARQTALAKEQAARKLSAKTASPSASRAEQQQQQTGQMKKPRPSHLRLVK